MDILIIDLEIRHEVLGLLRCLEDDKLDNQLSLFRSANKKGLMGGKSGGEGGMPVAVRRDIEIHLLRRHSV